MPVCQRSDCSGTSAARTIKARNRKEPAPVRSYIRSQIRIYKNKDDSGEPENQSVYKHPSVYCKTKKPFSYREWLFIINIEIQILQATPGSR